MTDATDDYSDVISRRQFVKLTGVSGAAALAGCSGGDSGDGSDGSSSADGVQNETLVGATNQGIPSNSHLNPMATQNYDGWAGGLVFERFAAYNYRKGEFELAALDSWSVDGKTVTLTLRDDLVWENGEDVTARDVLTQFRLMKKTGSALWDFTESVEKGEDDKTVVLTLKRASNPKIVKHTIGDQTLRLYAYHPVYKEFLDKDAAAVQQFKWEDDVVGNGPFSFESKSKQQWVFSRNENYYDADNVNFTKYKLLSRPDNTAMWQGLMGNELDVVTSLFAPPKVVANFPDRVEEVNIPAKWGYGLIFNHDDPDFGKRPVRKALAHVINRQQVAENAGPRTKTPAPKVTGIPPKDQQSALGQSYTKFDGYSMAGSDKEKASALLREAGYSKEGGTWKHSSGRTLGGKYVTPAGWTDWTTATNSVVDQLNSFGFDFQITSKPYGDYIGGYVDSNFKVGAFYWLPGGASSSFPFFPLRWQIENPDIDGGHNFPQEETTIPAMSGSGEMTIDPLSEIKTVATTQDQAKAQETIKRVAWHHNQTLPMLGLVGKLEQSWLTDDQWSVPESGSEARGVKWPNQWLPRQGELNAK